MSHLFVYRVKILHVVPTYLPSRRYGGPLHSIHGLCRELVKQGNDTHVYTTNVDGASNLDVPLRRIVDMDSVKVHYFSCPSLRRFYFSPDMKRAMDEEGKEFDIIHLHSIFLWPTWMAARYARTHDKPYLLAPRGMLVKDLVSRRGRIRKTAWIRFIEGRNLERADAVHATSEMECAEIRRFGLDIQRLVVVPNGYTRPQAADHSTSGGNAGRPTVLYLGRISWKKGLDRLMQAMSLVPEAELLVAGNDDEQYQSELEGLVSKFDLSERVRFLGLVGDAEKSRLLQSSDLLVLPSYSENFGNVVLEAMAHGCPVVVTPEVGISASVEKAGAGLVVPGEPRTLAGAITRVCGDPTLRRNMGEAGKRAAEMEFGWPRVAKQMIDVYQEIIENRGKGETEGD